MFVRPKDIKVGDFPPMDDFNEELDEIWKSIYVLKLLRVFIIYPRIPINFHIKSNVYVICFLFMVTSTASFFISTCLLLYCGRRGRALSRRFIFKLFDEIALCLNNLCWRRRILISMSFLIGEVSKVVFLLELLVTWLLTWNWQFIDILAERTLVLIIHYKVLILVTFIMRITISFAYLRLWFFYNLLKIRIYKLKILLIPLGMES